MIMSTLQQLAFEHVIWPIVSAALVGIFGWIAAKWQQYTGQKIDQKFQETYRAGAELAIKQALQKLLQDGRMSVDDEVVPTHEVDGVLTDAANYMQNKFPDTVKHFGVSFDGIKEALVARLPLPFQLNN